MTRVIHTGDTHIGYRQYHSPERREDFLRAFDQVISDAIDLDVSAVVHAGDLFHDTRPELADLLATLESLRRLAAADIPFLAIVGNHERTRDRQWIDLFAELDLAVHLGAAGTDVGDVTFYGVDFIPHSQRDAVDLSFEPPTQRHTAVLAHGLFEPFAHAQWDTGSFLDRLAVDTDALLLGDNHEPGQAEVGDTLVTYCGSTERTSASEEAQRGYNLVTFEDGDVRLSRRSLSATRPFHFLAIELKPDEGIDRIEAEIGERDLTDAVAIVRIDGDGHDVAPAQVEELALDAGALVARVNDLRDRPDAASHEINFADPSRAIDERLRSMELSRAGHDVASIVRDEGIADANVRDRVVERIRGLLDEDPQAFEPGTADIEKDADEGTDDDPPDVATEPEPEADTRDEPSATGTESEVTPEDRDEPEGEPVHASPDDAEDQRSLFEYR